MRRYAAFVMLVSCAGVEPLGSSLTVSDGGMVGARWEWSDAVGGNPNYHYAWCPADGLNPRWTEDAESAPNANVPAYLNGAPNAAGSLDPRPDISYNVGWNCGQDADPTKGKLCRDLESHYVDASGFTQMEAHEIFSPPTSAPWSAGAHAHRYFSLVGRTEPPFDLTLFYHADDIQIGTGYGPNEPALIDVYGSGAASALTLNSHDGTRQLALTDGLFRLSSRGHYLFFDDDDDHALRHEHAMPTADAAWDLGRDCGSAWCRKRWRSISAARLQARATALPACGYAEEGSLVTVASDETTTDSELWWCMVAVGSGPRWMRVK